MAGDGTVSGLGFHDIILVDTNGCHQAKRAEALSNNIGLDITIVVLTRPNKASLALEHLSDEIIDESVLVVNASGDEFFLVVSLIDILKDFHEEAVIFLQDRVFSGEFEGHATVEGVSHAGACKGFDRFVCVEHANVAASVFKVHDLLRNDITAIIGSECDVDFASFGHDVVLAPVLVTESVSSDNDRLGPAGYKSWDV